MDKSLPIKAFTKVDFPTLGFPIMDTKPDLWGGLDNYVLAELCEEIMKSNLETCLLKKLVSDDS